MERWGIAVNDVYKTGHIYREEGPWYIFFIEWLTDWICEIPHKLPCIPLPRWHVCRDCFLGSDLLEPGELTTLQEWYGDFAGLVHAKIHEPIFQWCHKHYKNTQMKTDIQDLAVFADWVNEFKSDTDDPFYEHHKFKELEIARQEIFRLWKERERLTDELIQVVKNRD